MAPVYKVQELANGNCTISKVQVPQGAFDNSKRLKKVESSPKSLHSMFYASSEKSERKLLAHYDPPNYLHLQGF